jgi:hypothetical protein
MKPRHVAALTLMGWYLMVPPQNPHWKDQASPSHLYNSNAPLNKWDIRESFDSAVGCQAALNRFINQGTYFANRTLNETHDINRATIVYQNWAAYRCVSTDDPRLKNN